METPPFATGDVVGVGSRAQVRYLADVAVNSERILFVPRPPKPPRSYLDPPHTPVFRDMRSRLPITAGHFGMETDPPDERTPRYRSDDIEQEAIRSMQLPTAAGLNRFKRHYLEPLGAHTLQYAYAKGEGQNNNFTAAQIIDGLQAGFLLIGATFGLLLHDTRDHALAAAAVHARPMAVHTALAEHSIGLRRTNPDLARKIAVHLAVALDTTTEYLPALMPPQSEPSASGRQPSIIYGSRLTSTIFTPPSGFSGGPNFLSPPEKDRVHDMVREIDPELAECNGSSWEVSEQFAAYYDSVGGVLTGSIQTAPLPEVAGTAAAARAPGNWIGRLGRIFGPQ